MSSLVHDGPLGRSGGGGALGVPAFACTPDLFPELMPAALVGRDLQQ